MITIKRFSELEQTPDQRAQIERIFFETSTRKEFESETERAAFRYQYLDLYLKTPEWTFLAIAPDQSIVGYLVATPTTSEETFKLLPSMENFRSQIHSSYPAHLHINLTEKARGANIGSKLLETMEQQLKNIHIPGVHLITVKTARNVSFYQKNNYHLVAEAEVKGVWLWMLGKRL